MGFKLKVDKRFTSKRPGQLAYLRLDSKDRIKVQTQAAAPHDGAYAGKVKPEILT
jgi:hypothetical protein